MIYLKPGRTTRSFGKSIQKSHQEVYKNQQFSCLGWNSFPQNLHRLWVFLSRLLAMPSSLINLILFKTTSCNSITIIMRKKKKYNFKQFICEKWEEAKALLAFCFSSQQIRKKAQLAWVYLETFKLSTHEIWSFWFKELPWDIDGSEADQPNL